MHRPKCIMVKIGGSKKRKLSNKSQLNENRGEIYKLFGNRGDLYFWEIGGNMQYASLAYRMHVPASANPKELSLFHVFFRQLALVQL